MRIASIVLTASLFLAPATPALAQITDEPLPPLRMQAGASLLIGQPVGELDDNLDVSPGIGGHVVFLPKPDGVFGLRADAGVMFYGHESKRVCFSETVGCRVTVDVNTTNSIAFFAAGPQVAAQRGFVRPYASAAIGIVYFGTSSGVEGADPDEDEGEFGENVFTTTNYDDANFSWSAGGGFLVPVKAGRAVISIDAGARYFANGQAEYLREDGITDNPDGSITLDPQRTDANFLVYQIGVSVGVRGKN